MATKGKSHKASLRRFKVTANGKLLRSQAGKKHLNSHKSSKRKRHLRKRVAISNSIAKRYVDILDR